MYFEHGNKEKVKLNKIKAPATSHIQNEILAPWIDKVLSIRFNPSICKLLFSTSFPTYLIWQKKTT